MTALRRAASLACALAAAGSGALAPPVSAAPPPVSVFYAGSLVDLFENDLAPAFERTTGRAAVGRPGGSVALARIIRDHLGTPDVFISADPAVNDLLAPRGTAPSAAWFLTLAGTSVVVAYAPRSPFAPRLRRAAEAASGPDIWYRVLAAPGFRLGRTDPSLDPKGYRVILVLRLAEAYYHEPGLAARLLGGEANPAQVFPEEGLLGRLASGQLDAGFFYLIEAAAQRLPYVALPDAVNLGSLAHRREYARVVYTDPSGRNHRGGPIVYTVTIPSTARHPDGAVRFMEFLLGPAGRRLLRAHGFLDTPVLAGGERRAVPAPLRRLVQGAYQE